uniref:TerD domain-containing protein n=1 Tax=Vannella robusta TaxID=1487602 RepID=A0A7S4MGL0_9EUKA|mmetsp:Transcript_21642/g.27542  ORF Transcript_21642/g.27542 Transcript_21642/m.27542 type:complete len:205 (+) Transcript_21642:2-616(+)
MGHGFCLFSLLLQHKMPINLKKGGINLTKLQDSRGVGLSQIYIGLGWDMAPGNGNIDLDACIAGLGANDKLLADEWFVFYNNLTSPDRVSIVHNGDNKTGQGDGDDESINIDLTKIPPQVVKLLVIISMHDAQGKNFTQVQNAFFRIVDANTKQETHRLDLSAGQGGTTECLIFAEIVRDQGGWSIKPVCFSVPSLGALLGNLQ